MINSPTELYGFYHGASWMALDGTMYIVPGFHDEWIHSHQELSGDAKNVSDLVITKRWISVVVFNEGYVEVCINNRHDEEVLLTLYTFLKKHTEKWETVLIMTMEEEGYIQLEKNTFKDKEAFFCSVAELNCP